MTIDLEAAQDRIVVDCLLAAGGESSLANDVLDGLTRPFKELPPKHFYDAHGAELFDQICEQPEYYPTRTERSILQARSREIAATTGAVELVELGSGTAAKTRVLLDAMRAAGTLQRYVPLDVTETMVRTTAAELVLEYPGLHVHGIVGDFEQHLDRLPAPLGPRIFAFLGGTLGNFIPGSRRRFLSSLADTMMPGDHLLLGTDLVKDPAILEAAYNDAAGVTAAFNRNVLRVVNAQLDADFDAEAFEHVAFFNREHQWIEMRLRASAAQQVTVRALDLAVSFAPREEMRTEISAKFTPARLRADLDAAGLALKELFTDDDGLFALSLADCG